MSRRDRPAGAPMTFFSFQDIIACTTGILVIVTLILMTDLARVQARDADAESPKSLAALAAKLDDAQQRKRAQDEQLARLHDDLNQLAGRQRVSTDDLDDIRQARDRLQQRLTDQEKSSRLQSKKLVALKQQLDEAKREEETLRTTLVELQRRIVAEKKSRRIHLEGADETQKQYWFVEVTDAAITIGSYDRNTQSARRAQTFSSIEAFLAWVDTRSSHTDALCLEIKPDGARHFQRMFDEMGARGFGFGDIGWNLLPQDFVFFEE